MAKTKFKNDVEVTGKVIATGGIGSANQTLTVSGAIGAGVRNVRLNHATVVVAATWTPTPGPFSVTDTSASGTAAHTVTLGGGATWNGTNTVATLNAPAESLIGYFDDSLVGNIIVNTGSVALS